MFEWRGKCLGRGVGGCMGSMVVWVLERWVSEWGGKCGSRGKWMFGYRNR